MKDYSAFFKRTRTSLFFAVLWCLLITEASTTAQYRETPESHMSVNQIALILKERMPHLKKKKATSLAEHLSQLCKKHGFAPSFILSVIDVESSFRPRARSHRNAIGLMQVLHPTAQGVSRMYKIPYRNYRDLHHPHTNLSIGVQYLAHLRKRFRGQTFHMVAAYNAGPTKIARLLAQNRFKPVQTLAYYKAILKRVAYFRLLGNRLSHQVQLASRTNVD